MAAPVRANSGQIVEAKPAASSDNQGSYPAEITQEQFAWLQERAAQRRREWAEHAQSWACNQKS